jgi:NADP-dependent 3-hydroxy acid dehydrogenase YdfG
VIGASSQIGGAVAAELAALGMSVTAWGRDPDRLPAADFTDRVDLTDAAEVGRAIGELPARGPLRTVVYAAGVFDWAPADRADATWWTEVFDVNLTAAARVTAHVLPTRGCPTQIRLQPQRSTAA